MTQQEINQLDEYLVKNGFKKDNEESGLRYQKTIWEQVVIVNVFYDNQVLVIKTSASESTGSWRPVNFDQAVWLINGLL